MSDRFIRTLNVHEARTALANACWLPLCKIGSTEEHWVKEHRRCIIRYSVRKPISGQTLKAAKYIDFDRDESGTLVVV